MRHLIMFLVGFVGVQSMAWSVQWATVKDLSGLIIVGTGVFIGIWCLVLMFGGLNREGPLHELASTIEDRQKLKASGSGELSQVRK